MTRPRTVAVVWADTRPAGTRTRRTQVKMRSGRLIGAGWIALLHHNQYAIGLHPPALSDGCRSGAGAGSSERVQKPLDTGRPGRHTLNMFKNDLVRAMPQRKGSEDTRRLIYETALALFREQGFEQTTM